MIERLAWVTTRAARGRDEDEPIGLAALERAGVQVELVDWDDTDADWAAFDRVVLRSSWDYPERLPEFLEWLERIAALTEVLNPPATVRWNLDKHYLGELADAGVPITPTVFVEPGDSVEFPVGDFVVKPAIGAGSRDASSYGPDQRDAARSHVDRLLGLGQSVLVQPFLASVATDGEWPLVFFHGVFSHAASKRVTLPRAGTVEDLFAAETNATHTATDEQVAVAQAAMDVVAGRVGVPAYARVDLVNDDDGRPCVLEVELIEPSLFLPYAGPEAADRFAGALTSPTPVTVDDNATGQPLQV